MTRDDMAAHGALLRGEMAEIRGEPKSFRGEMNLAMAELKGSTQRMIVAGMAVNAVALVTVLVA